MAFENNFDNYSWNNSGSEPTAELMQNGYQERYHPPAGIFNWFWHKVIACIKEIQKKLKIHTVAEGDDDNIRYEYRADNSLHIFGIGAMPAHTNETAYPWYEYNSSAREIHIHNGITSIPAKAFKGFGKVVEMGLSNSITTIGNNAFEGCLTLRHLHLPLSLTSIGDNAFKGCSRLTALSIPVTVTSIGNSAFAACTAISHVCYEGTSTQFNSITIATGNNYLTSADRYYNTHCITDSDALMMRDMNGRCTIASPVANADIANKSYVDNLCSVKKVEIIGEYDETEHCWEFDIDEDIVDKAFFVTFKSSGYFTYTSSASTTGKIQIMTPAGTTEYPQMAGTNTVSVTTSPMKLALNTLQSFEFKLYYPSAYDPSSGATFHMDDMSIISSIQIYYFV